MKLRKLDGRAAWTRLGSFSRDTMGDGGPHWEASGLQRNAGLTPD